MQWLNDDEFIYVWDVCGELGFSIPWAEWKCYGIFPFNTRARNMHKVLKIPVVYLCRIADEKKAEKLDHVVYLEEHKRQESGLIAWQEVLEDITQSARDGGCVISNTLEQILYETNQKSDYVVTTTDDHRVHPCPACGGFMEDASKGFHECITCHKIVKGPDYAKEKRDTPRPQKSEEENNEESTQGT